MRQLKGLVQYGEVHNQHGCVVERVVEGAQVLMDQVCEDRGLVGQVVGVELA